MRTKAFLLGPTNQAGRWKYNGNILYGRKLLTGRKGGFSKENSNIWARNLGLKTKQG